MNILTFIKQSYPIKDRVRELLADPLKRIKEMDDLPYDVIGVDESTGQITKLVQVEEDRWISVLDLLSYTREDILILKDEALLLVWDAYMDSIDITDLNVIDIMECSRKYQEMRNKGKERLRVLSGGEEREGDDSSKI